MTAAACIEVRSTYSLEAAARRMKSLYQELIKHRSHAA